MRLIFKQLLAGFLYYTGLLILWVSLKQTLHSNGNIIILTYHCFLDMDDPLKNLIQDGMCITPQNFENQILFFKKHYQLVSLDAIIDGLITGKPLPRRYLAITVDDGWRNNFTNCFPIIKKYGVPVTIFLTVDFVERNLDLWFLKAARILEQGKLSASNLASALASVSKYPKEKIQKNISDSHGNVDLGRFIELLKLLTDQNQQAVLQLLKSQSGVTGQESESQRNSLNWDEIRQMSNHGVAFGSHGNSHQILTLLSSNEVAMELNSSREKLVSQIGTKIRHFSYPNGNYNNAIAALVKVAGYDSGLTTTGGTRPRGRDMDRYMLRRIGMHDGTSTGVFGRFSKAMLAFYLARYG